MFLLEVDSIGLSNLLQRRRIRGWPEIPFCEMACLMYPYGSIIYYKTVILVLGRWIDNIEGCDIVCASCTFSLMM